MICLIVTQKQYEAMLRSFRELYIRVDLLDFKTDAKLQEIQGVCIDGNVNINASSNNRRIANVKFAMADESFTVGQDRKFWINKKIRIFTGLMDYTAGEIVWFLQGSFLINNPTISISASDKTVSFDALDYMCLIDGTMNGSLGQITEHVPVLPISESIKSLITQLVGINSYNIEPNEFYAEYTIRKSATDTKFSIIKELSDMYMDYEFFFDENGVFVYRRIRNYEEDPILWDFRDTNHLIISHSVTSDFSNVKNCVQVWGRVSNGAQLQYYVENTDLNNPYNVFSDIGKRLFTYQNDKIYTYEQIKARGDYELKQHCSYNDKLVLDTVPIYSLDANQIIFFKDLESPQYTGRYLIDTISFPLSHDGVMNLSAYRIY